MITIVFTLSIKAQDEVESKWKDKINFSGYLRYMNSLSVIDSDSTLSDNLIHNRLRIKVNFNSRFDAVVEIRNRGFFGQATRSNPNLGKFLNNDTGELDLSFVPYDRRKFVIHSIFDRAYMKYASDKWELRLGRQRINWGVNLAWNPNDLFNAYSLIDFDYITSNLKLILKTEDPKGANYSKIHIQLNESQSSQKPFKKMNPKKKYQTMVLNLSNFKSSINQNKHNDFEIVNITSKNDLVSKLNKIQNIAFENSWGYSPNTKDEIIKKIESNNSLNDGIFFALLKSEPVGFVWPTKDTFENKIGYISMIGTHPKFTGKGIASALLNKAINYFTLKEFEYIKLEVDTENIGAKSVYGKLNFIDEETKYWFEFSSRSLS